MSCGGCGGGGPPADLVRERAAICRVCPEGERRGFGVVACTVSGRRIEEHLYGVPCPADHHPDAEGIVNWLGIRWYGVPWPVRVWTRFTHRSKPRLNSWRGCGCIKRAKDLYSSVFGGSDHGVRTGFNLDLRAASAGTVVPGGGGR